MENQNRFADPSANVQMERVVEQPENDFVISSDYYEQQILTDEESIRQSYEQAYPEDYVDETITVNSIDVFVNTREKTSRSGNTYTSNLCITRLYIDEDETRLAFFDEMFNRYDEENNTITVTGNHPLAEIVRVLTGNTRDNRFVIDLGRFQDRLARIDQLRCRIYSYVDNGYVRYSFNVLAFSEE